MYVDQTNNLEKRLSYHQTKSAKAAKYTRYFESVKLVYKEEYKTKIEALTREYQLMKWTKPQKEALITGKLGFSTEVYYRKKI